MTFGKAEIAETGMRNMATMIAAAERRAEVQPQRKFYPVSVESRRPDDMRSGINTEVVEIYTSPGTTNMSHEERETGWLGTSNDVSRTALGAFASLDACRTFLRGAGYIPTRECCESVRESVCECDTGDGENTVVEQWHPVVRQYEEIANYRGHDGLDSWLYDMRDELAARVANGESADDIAAELESEANDQGYTLVGLRVYLLGIREAMET